MSLVDEEKTNNLINPCPSNRYSNFNNYKATSLMEWLINVKSDWIVLAVVLVRGFVT